MPAASFWKSWDSDMFTTALHQLEVKLGAAAVLLTEKVSGKTANVWNHGVNNAAVYKSLKQTHVEDWTLFAKWTLRRCIINEDGCWPLMFSLLHFEHSENIPAGFQSISPKDSVRKQTEPDLERSAWAKWNVTNLLQIPAFDVFYDIKTVRNINNQ